MLPTLRTFEYNYSTHQRIIQLNKVLDITQIFNICSKVLVALTPIQILHPKVQGESGLPRDSTIWLAIMEVSSKY